MKRTLNREQMTVLVLEGDDLKPRDAEKLEEELFCDESLIENRLKLIGFYFSRYQTSPAHKRNRFKHIEWIIQHYYNHPFCASEFVRVFRSQEKRNYQEIKQLWERLVSDHPDDVQVRLNAISAIFMAEPIVAKRLVTEAPTLMLKDSRILDMLNKIIDRETSFPSRELPDKPNR